MTNIFLSGFLLSVLWLTSFFPDFFNRQKIRLVGLASLVILLYLSWLTFSQYQLWLHNNIARYFLPPHDVWSYFIYYSLLRIWSSYLISFLAGFIIAGLMFLFNRYFAYRFFYAYEYVLVGLSIALLGYPLFIFYLPLSLFLYLILSLFNSFLSSFSHRFSLAGIWVPLSLFVIIISETFITTTALWRLLKLF